MVVEGSATWPSFSHLHHTHGRWGYLEVSKVGEVGGVWNDVNIKMFHKIIPIKM